MKKKTLKDKKLEGTARADRSGVIPSTDIIPEPSPKLPNEARKYYDAFARHLADNNSLQAIDGMLIERAAKCFHELQLAEDEKAAQGNGGNIAISSKGVPYVSPYFNTVQALEKKFLDFCAQLGVGPKARHLMSGTFEKKQEEERKDPLADLMPGQSKGSTTVS
jgi:phage terminase small subunit